MFNKIMPLKYPYITHKPTIAYLLSILGTNPQTEGWVISNYANFYINKTGKADFWGKDNLFNNCPWIFHDSISRELLISNSIDIIDFCKSNLKLNYYLYFMINEKYIKVYNNQQNFTHNILIYGLDDKNKKVHIADFFVDGKYSFTTCSYDELIKSFNDSFLDNTGYYEAIRTIKLKDILFVLEPNSIKKSIEEYISSENLFLKYNKVPFEESLELNKNNQYIYFSNNYLENNYFFGLEFYKQLYLLFKEEKYRDVRAFHLIYDKMVLMNIRLGYLKAHNLISSYEKLSILSKENVSEALMLRNMLIKSNINGSSNLNNRILDKLKFVMDSDCAFCNILIDSI